MLLFLKKIFPIIIALSICSCLDVDNKSEKKEHNFIQEDVNNIRAYYYPLKDSPVIYQYNYNEMGKVYVSHYLKFNKEKEGENIYLFSEVFNPELIKDQEIKEWIIDDGIITQKYSFYVFDSTNNKFDIIENEISENVVFPFKPVQDTNMVYRFKCTNRLPPDYTTVKLVRDRKYIGKTNIEYKGEVYNAVEFQVIDFYDIEDKEKGGFWNMNDTIEEIYAENIGLVYKKKKNQEGYTYLEEIIYEAQ